MRPGGETDDECDRKEKSVCRCGFCGCRRFWPAGLSRSTACVRLDQGRFRRPVSPVGRIGSEVDEWIRERIAPSRDDAE